MLYMPDREVRRLLSLEQLISSVIDLLVQQKTFSGLNAEETIGGINLATKGGCITNLGYGVRIRTGGEGQYTTVAWDAAGKFVGALDASSLTYLRTAALLLALPFQTQMTVRRALVMGTGKLGTACIELLCHLYPQASIYIWSRSQYVFPSPWLRQAFPEQVQWWKPVSQQQETFDILLTCTRSQDPLADLMDVSAHYAGIGGAVNGQRRELPPSWLEQAHQICADDPARAREKCGDLAKSAVEIAALSTCLRSPVVLTGHTLCFICGIGAIDIGMALLLLKEYQASKCSEQ